MYLIIECKINFVNRGNSMEKRTIRTGNIEITYILTRKKVKNINMRVKADGNVYVSASNRVSVDYIDRFVASKAEFIMKAIVKMQLKQTDKIKTSLIIFCFVLHIRKPNLKLQGRREAAIIQKMCHLSDCPVLLVYDALKA